MTLAIPTPSAARSPADTAQLIADLAAAAASKDITTLVSVAVELGRRLGPAAPAALGLDLEVIDAGRRISQALRGGEEDLDDPERGHALPTPRAVRQTRPTAAALRKMAAAGEALVAEVEVSGGTWR